MRRVFGRAVGAVTCVLVAACAGGATGAIEPVTFIRPSKDPSVTLAPRLVRVDGAHADAIRAAHAAAQAVIETSTFAQALASVGLLATAPDAAAANDVTGAMVATDAFAVAAPIEYRSVRRCGGTTASTALSTIEGAPGATITLFTATIDRLGARDRETTACVINTFVHEWTHVARAGNDFAYVDTGRGAATRPLVSYTVGAVAQCVYLAAQHRDSDGGEFALERCIGAAASVPLDPSTCVTGWGEQFVRSRTEVLW